jgi:hypothetical protein
LLYLFLDLKSINNLSLTCKKFYKIKKSKYVKIHILKLKILPTIKIKNDEWLKRKDNSLRKFCFIPRGYKTEVGDLTEDFGYGYRIKNINGNCNTISIIQFADVLLYLIFDNYHKKIIIKLGLDEIIELENIEPNKQYYLLKDKNMGFPVSHSIFQPISINAPEEKNLSVKAHYWFWSIYNRDYIFDLKGSVELCNDKSLFYDDKIGLFNII